ncbi:serine/threonine protein kinase [Nocardia panacis]|uniref:non-specific serine/threonine protein kinase n=2 Tax=Nocardia panacis TaxID=2340916 RepID=A0A3A4L0M2_9NOCA|nr:serine/threonine protein kinase [Nocardia panacis]
MGEVYEAHDTAKDRIVALKLLTPELAADPVFQERFRRESQAAARLAEPHVIPIHDWGSIDGTLYIDMRLVRGADLKSVLREQAPLGLERAVRILDQIASALDAAHADRLVHRDVKPANILVTPTDFAYLVDFGIARSTGDPSVTATGAAIGSYSYIAPERFEGGPVGGATDIYSLACVLYECLTGAQAFRAGSMSALIHAHLSQAPPRPSLVRPDIPAAMDAVIARGLAKSPGDRYASACQLTAAAADALVGRSSAPPTNRMPIVAPAPPTVRFPEGGTERVPKVVGPQPDPRSWPAVRIEPVRADRPEAVPHGDGGMLSRSDNAAPQPDSRRGRIWKVLLGVFLVSAVVVGAAAGVWFLRPPPAPAPPPVTSAPPLPTDAQPCTQVYPATGRFTASAIGTPVTSCRFAEEVRKAYAAAASGPGQVTVVAHSPVRDQDYEMTCQGDRVVVCRGGENAVVYLY